MDSAKRSIGTEYYPSLPSMMNRMQATGRALGLQAHDRDAYVEWRRNLREKLAELTGLGRMIPCDLLPQEMGEPRLLDGYRREKLRIQTEPDVWMPFYVLVPDGLEEGEKRPVVIAAHGHLGGGKESVAGVADHPAVRQAIEEYGYDYGVQLVRQGYVVLCPDARGFGERREYWMQGDEASQVLGASCNHLNHAAVAMGHALIGWLTWDLQRLIDFIPSLPYADADRIGCVGFSGGGMQALWLAAMDERVRAVVVSGYFSGYRDVLLLGTHCGCNYVPRLWEYADYGDIGALVAPRPMLVESGDDDRNSGPRRLANVTEQLDVTRKAYALFGSEDRLVHAFCRGGHRWYGERTAEFLEHAL
ncbi:alpha/beta hydrolase family protein [Cohnella caldifontis]|uniref:alpha/beta hydrolase family protein n=1 Tax=Cohnella caldifontis TaxID=3027471 RepID=UPI0023EB2AED|nr:alpha/beta fold hydrolase [Cohnella sp. YIM B05605]